MSSTIDDFPQDKIRDALAEALGVSAESLSEEQLEEYMHLFQQEQLAETAWHVRFEEQVARTPLASAITVVDAAAQGKYELHHISYQELNQQANRLARALQGHLTANMLVGIAIERSLEQVLAILSVLKAGAASILIDPETPVAAMQLLLSRLNVSILLIKSPDNLGLSSTSDRQIVTLEELEAVSGPESQNIPFHGTNASTAYVLTSGIAIDHQSILRRLYRLQRMYKLTDRDALVGTASSPETFVLEVLWPLLYGARVIISSIRQPEQNLALVEQAGGTLLCCVPPQLPAYDTMLQRRSTSLRLLLCEGGLAAPNLIEQRVWNTSFPLSYLVQSRTLDMEIAQATLRSPCEPSRFTYTIVPGISAYVLDKNEQIAPPGSIGIVYVSEETCGMWPQNHSALQVAQNPLGDDMLIATEFSGKLLSQTAQIVILDAPHQMAWLDGRAVSLEEIRRALLADMAIEDCAVYVRTVEHSGAQQIVAYVVPAQTTFASEQVHLRLSSVLPPFLLPAVYTALERLPLTSDGKIDEATLLRQEVLDDDVCRTFEQRLQASKGVSQAVAVIQQKHEARTFLHISDILSSTKETSDVDEAVDNLSQQRAEEVTQPPALAHGAPLQIEPGLPWTLGDTLQRAVRLWPEKGITYITLQEEVREQTFTQLLGEASRILAGLRQQGLQPGATVIFQLEHNWDIVPAYWACMLGGFAPAILALPPTYQEANNALDKLIHCWKVLDYAFLITSHALSQSVTALRTSTPEAPVSFAFIEDVRAYPPEQSYHQSNPDDTALFSLTSGSTGMPKCIVLTHRQLLGRARATQQSGLNDRATQDIVMNWLPFDHIGTISDHHIRCVDIGCQTIYVPTSLILQRPLLWLDIMDRYRCTHTWAPNFAYVLLMDALKEPEKAHWDLSCVKSLLTAGESVSAQVIEQFLQIFARYGLKKTSMQSAFGMAELCSGNVYFLPTEDCPVKAYRVDKRSLHGSLRFVSADHPQSISFTALGRLVPGYSMRIVDEEGALLPERRIGRLQIKGEYVFSGYYKNPEQNRASFIDGWFNTGDLAFLCDSYLVITGREKEVIIINGANHFNHDIENVVNAIPGVAVSYSAACAVRAEGTEGDRLAIFFVSESSDERDLITFMREIKIQVARQIGATPDYIIPVKREDIPKTTIGKIQRSQLSRRFEQGEFQAALKYAERLSGNEHTLPEWFYRKIWVVREEASVLNGYCLPLIFLDQEGLGDAVASHYDDKAILVRAGSHFARHGLRSFTIDASRLADYRQLLHTLAQEHLLPDTLLHLWSYSRPPVEMASIPGEHMLQEGVVSLLLLCQALEQEGYQHLPTQLLVVSSHVQAVKPGDALVSAKATLSGLLKTVAQEYPWLRCRHIDLTFHQLEQGRATLLREMGIVSGEREVAYREGKRYVARLEKMTFAPAQSLPFQKGALYVISGGLGGIGVEVASYLLTHFQARLLLLGRSVLPPREQWSEHIQQKHKLAAHIQALQQLEALGGQVQYEAVDICDVEAVQIRATKVATAWQQPVAGVIHLAGLFHERPLSDETQASLQALLRPKMLGAWSLYQLIKQQPGSLFIIFSSLSGFFGGALVGAYAAANSFADTFAAYLRNTHAIDSYSLAWSVWKEIGIGHELDNAEILATKGYQAISAQQGINSLLVVLAQREHQALIGLDASKQHVRRFIKRTSLSLHTLAGYFTATDNQVQPEQIYQSVHITDRFQNPCAYEIHQLQKLPLLENGAVDYASLIAQGIQAQTSTNEYTPPRTEIERSIAQIWQEVLGVSRVGIYNNLFELGGDSIHITQIVYKMRNIGLLVSVKQLFQYSTIAELTRHLQENATVIDAEQGPIEGEIPLTVAQWAFFEKQLPNPHYFNQAYMFEPKLQVNPISLEGATAALIAHHDALRLRLQPTEHGWLQSNAAHESHNCFAVMDLSRLPAHSQSEALAEHIAQIHRSLHLTHGPLVRVVLFLLPDGSDRLLFVFHHFVTDQLSWKILLEDFFTAYQQLEVHTQPSLPPKSSSLQAWSRQLVQYASSKKIQDEHTYWRNQPWSEAVTLPYEHPEASNKEAWAQVVMQALSQQETETLLQQATRVYSATMQELVLAAFNDALAAWLGEGLLPLELTHHGRDPLFENLDVSRTVGWFSIAFPVLLSMKPTRDLRERIRQVQQTLQRVPDHGYSYGLLRYVCADESIRESMSHIPRPEVLFNYLGQADHIRAESTYLRPAKEARGSIHDPEGERLYQLVFNGRLVNGRLEVLCLYGKAVIDTATVTRIIEHMLDVFRKMIVACSVR